MAWRRFLFSCESTSLKQSHPAQEISLGVLNCLHHDPKKISLYCLEGASIVVCTLRFPWFLLVISNFQTCFMFTLVIQFSCPHIFKTAKPQRRGETWADANGWQFPDDPGAPNFREGNFKGWTGKLRGCMGNILLSFHGNLYHTYSIHNHDVMWLCAAQNLISKPFSHVCTTFGKEPGTLNCSYWSNHFINLQP